ncbi:MAG: Segregation and condensation protein A [Candidatus Dichloromethanomonas elyunquensis]|nr:MAG: Segregation and condensation protein A [Candidatus Dichloromethanomonas elyunquensis]
MEAAKQTPYVELPAFQGPLDLLLHLIQQNKVDIYDIPIAVIADQFIATVKKMEELDMDITSEFLVLAAQLLHLKSRQLLPKPQKTEEDLQLEEELKQDLVERLIAYRAFKEMAVYLGSRAESSGNRYFREIDLDEFIAKLKPPNPLLGVGMDELMQAFDAVLKRVEKGEYVHYVQVDEIPVEMMIDDIMRRMILNPKGMRFIQLLRYKTRAETVVAFVAILELLKEGKIRAEQGEKRNDIFIVPTDRAWDLINEESV